MPLAAPVLPELCSPEADGCVEHEEVVRLGLEALHAVHLRQEGQELWRGPVKGPSLGRDVRVELHCAEELCPDPPALHRLVGVEVQAAHRVHLVRFILAVEHEEVLDAPF